MKTLLIALLLASTGAHAQTIIKGVVQKKVEISGKPSFFFKVHGSGSLLSYTLANDPNQPASLGTNHLFNIETGQDLTIPGPWDPVFVAGSNYMILPRGKSASSITYELHNLKKLKDSKTDSLIGNVSNVSGLYQSVGILSVTGTVTKMRLMAEDGSHNHKVKDFQYDSASNALTIADEGVFQKICSNFSLKLPMLSKDGRFLGGIDLETKKTAIWKINSDFTCNKVKDFPIKTGKLNFSYDSSKVTYHIYNQPVQESEDRSDEYIAIPSDDFVSDIFVLDLKTDKTIRVTTNINTNSMYPDFTLDGRLVFINHPHDDAKKVNFIFLKL